MKQNPHYELVARSLAWLSKRQMEQPNLDRLARAMGVSASHLQRTFQLWAGVSPKQFLKTLTRNAARKRLVAGSTVLEAALETGLSGPGRLHDLMVSTDALTPGEIRRRGEGIALQYGSGHTPFGKAVIAWSERGVCFLGFSNETGENAVIGALRESWHKADFRPDLQGSQHWLDRIFIGSHRPLRLWLRGSPFQLKVWEALLQIPEGAHLTYGRIAEEIGQPSAARAVGTAVGRNPVAWLIPCHRVIRRLGVLGEYRWGALTKQAMIGYEASLAINASETGSSGGEQLPVQSGESATSVASGSTLPSR